MSRAGNGGCVDRSANMAAGGRAGARCVPRLALLPGARFYGFFSWDGRARAGGREPGRERTLL